MAPRCGDDEIARVLSKLGRRTGKGNRWSQARVATVRRKHHIAAPNATDPEILNLAQAQKHTGVSDTTLMRLIRTNLLPVQQVAPYAPLEIKRADLDAEPVAGIFEHLESTGMLVLDRDPSAEQAHLFLTNQSLAQRGYCGCTIMNIRPWMRDFHGACWRRRARHGLPDSRGWMPPSAHDPRCPEQPVDRVFGLPRRRHDRWPSALPLTPRPSA
jgi:hypothetical protein